MASLAVRTCWSQLMQCVDLALGPDAISLADGEISLSRRSTSLRMPRICILKSLRSAVSAFSSSAAATRSLTALRPRRMAPSSWEIRWLAFFSEADRAVVSTFPVMATLRLLPSLLISLSIRPLISTPRASSSVFIATTSRSAFWLESCSMRSSMEESALITRLTFLSALSTAVATDFSSIDCVTESTVSSLVACSWWTKS
mmetsp:Transcript_2222/g.6567  ORF Transcript_2222/g.6567 Transcript_2222/m.6567 type:complete len:201 (-) Transcript_2222:82-684(-)